MQPKNKNRHRPDKVTKSFKSFAMKKRNKARDEFEEFDLQSFFKYHSDIENEPRTTCPECQFEQSESRPVHAIGCSHESRT